MEAAELVLDEDGLDADFVEVLRAGRDAALEAAAARGELWWVEALQDPS